MHKQGKILPSFDKSNTHGLDVSSQALLKYTPSSRTVLSLVETEYKFVAVSSGLNHHAFVTDTGAVLMIGSGSYGENGISNQQLPDFKQIPPHYFNNERIIDVSTYNVHNLFLSESGKLYSCGANWYGQCGINNATSSSSQQIPHPMLIQPAGQFNSEKDRVVCISAGIYQSLVITASGKVFGFGQNRNMEIGIEGRKENIFEPTNLLFEKHTPHRVVKVATSNQQSLFLTDAGEVFLCGIGSGIRKIQDSGIDIVAGYTPCFVRTVSTWHVEGNDSFHNAAATGKFNLSNVEMFANTYGTVAITKDRKFISQSDGEGVEAVGAEDLKAVPYDNVLPVRLQNMRPGILSYGGGSGYIVLFAPKFSYSSKLHSLCTNGKLVDIKLVTQSLKL